MKIFLRYQIQLLLVVVILNLVICIKRSKKSKNPYIQTHVYEIYPSDTIPSDVQVTTLLNKGTIKRLHYRSMVINSPLSVTVMTCSSPVAWSMDLEQNSLSTHFLEENFTQITKQITTTNYISQIGLYTISMVATEFQTYAHVYISTEDGGSQALKNGENQSLKLLRKQKKGCLTVKWEPSLIDPQGTEYCLVVSTDKYYHTLCSAEADKYGISTSSSKQLQSSSQTIISWQPTSPGLSDTKNIFPSIACVGKKTHYTLTTLKEKRIYYFSAFAINKQTNLTYPYGSILTKFDNKIKPQSLKDGKMTFTNLKKVGGVAIFRFKTRKKSGDYLNIYIMPCGQAVYADVKADKQKIISKKRIERFDKVHIPDVRKGTRYIIKITSPFMEDFDQTTGVAIFASTRPTSNIPLPELPHRTSLFEYESLRKCDSITIGWVPSPGQTHVSYCFIVHEGTLKENEEYAAPNQCGLENRLRKSVDFAVKYCKEMKQGAEQVLTERIGQLVPGRQYIVQLTIKKRKGKSLSYDLLQVQTKSLCEAM